MSLRQSGLIFTIILLMYMSISPVFAQIGIQRNPNYISGPWVYTAVPCDLLECAHEDLLNVDYLSKYTDTLVLEQDLATANSKPEEVLFLGGRLTWYKGFLAGKHIIFSDNIGTLVDAVELNPAGFSNGIFYGLIVLNVNKEAETTMRLGYTAYTKIWINGEIVYTSEGKNWAEASEMRQEIPVSLKRGKNLIMVKVIEGIGWNLFVNFNANFKVSYHYWKGRIVVDDILPVEPSSTTISTRWATLKKRNR